MSMMVCSGAFDDAQRWQYWMIGSAMACGM
jgi:hypothetical protein